VTRRLLPVLLAALLALAALPSPAGAADPFSPLPAPAPQTPTPTQTTAPSSSSSGRGLSQGAQIALFVVGALLLAFIARAIVRDARRSTRAEAAPRRAPRPVAPPAPGARGRPTGKGSAAQRKRRKR
jgi:hypothetical protein